MKHRFLPSLWFSALLTLGVILLSSVTWVQTYPSKPVRLFEPFPAGGATDIFARVLFQKPDEKFGSTVVVETRPGAGGTIVQLTAELLKAQTGLFIVHIPNTGTARAITDFKITFE